MPLASATGCFTSICGALSSRGTTHSAASGPASGALRAGDSELGIWSPGVWRWDWDWDWKLIGSSCFSVIDVRSLRAIEQKVRSEKLFCEAMGLALDLRIHSPAC